MTSPFRNWIRSDREGQTLAVVAVSMVALLAIMSLGIDLGMAYTARAEAQRVADSAALAGASVFLDVPEPLDPEAAAEARARDYASRNVVRNRPVDPDDDVMVWVLLDEEKVRVRIERRGLPTWFARFIGQDNLTVSAIAAAQALTDGATDCLKPWAVLDAFLKTDGSVPAADEAFHPDTHDYAPSDAVCGGGTGYGANTLRSPSPDCDYGLQLTIKSQRPNQDAVPEPGVFMPIRLDPTENQDECTKPGGGESDAGASTYRQNICACNGSAISIGDKLPIQTGNMVGPTEKGVNELIERDPLATWDPNTGTITGSEFGLSSPRVVKMVLISPGEIVKSGMQEVTVRNFGQFFIEGIVTQGTVARVTGRFLYYMDGVTGSSGEATSSLIKTLRLVE